MEDFGATVTPTDEGFFVQGKHLHGGRIFLPEASVTVTENALMVASSIPETTIICNAACEPHVQNLADFLRSMGATITGDGTNTITITGKKTLHAGKITVIPDQIEIGTWALGAAITNGDLTIEGVIAQHLDIILYKFHEAGIRCHLEEGENQTKLIIQRTPREELRAINLTTNIWPGFPTDLQAPFTVLLTQANGVSLVHDWMYEGRLFYIDILSRMGANITLCDPHRAIVYGPTPLQGNKQIESPDLRAGMALVLAGLAAEGTTVIDNIELVDRGYENLDERLISLGASCRRVS
jgi:UDP-N-acetylglucosamine 1-carboxyvinyltransferase